MNREILFRGKRLDNGEWVTGCLITDDRDGKEFIVCSIGYHWEEDNGSTNRCMECFGFEVDPETVGQYTGLKDKNGVKIFEGDIIFVRGEVELACGDCCAWNHNAVVKWDANECKYFLDVIDKQEIRISEYGFYHYDTFVLREWAEDEWWFEYRVEGNIHDNTELLGVLGDE